MSSLELQAALNAHSAWKVNFQLLISGLTTMPLVAKVVVDNTKCELAKWLEDRRLDYSGDPVFQQLEATHRDFHKVAAEIILLIAAEKHTDAQALLDGAFSDLSNDIVERLQQMRSVQNKTCAK
jgi:hypothetical protein